MGKLIERLRKGREKLKLRLKKTRDERELKSAFKSRLKEIREKKRQAFFEESTQKEIMKQERITGLRKAQLERASTEAKILQAKARRVTAQRKISGRPQGFGPSQAVGDVQRGFKAAARAPQRIPGARPPGAVLLDIGPQGTTRVRPTTSRLVFLSNTILPSSPSCCCSFNQSSD